MRYIISLIRVIELKFARGVDLVIIRELCVNGCGTRPWKVCHICKVSVKLG